MSRQFIETPTREEEEGFRRVEPRMLDNQLASDMGRSEGPLSKYHREIRPGVWVDVYDVLKAFDVHNPAMQHLLKKALAPGQRGHKDLMTDLDDIIASAKRAKELEQ